MRGTYRHTGRNGAAIFRSCSGSSRKADKCFPKSAVEKRELEHLAGLLSLFSGPDTNWGEDS